jgi:hypothetical protein
VKLLLQDWPSLHPLISDIHNDPKMHISIASCKSHLTLKTGCKLDGGKGNIWNKLVYSMHIKLITVSVISWFVLLACGPWLKKSEACHNFSRLLALRNSAALSQVLYRLSLTDRSHPVSRTACLPGAEVRITLLLGWLDNVGFKTNHIWKLGMRRAYLHSNTKHVLELFLHAEIIFRNCLSESNILQQICTFLDDTATLHKSYQDPVAISRRVVAEIQGMDIRVCIYIPWQPLTYFFVGWEIIIGFSNL